MRTILMTAGLVMAMAGGAVAEPESYVVVDGARLHQRPTASSKSIQLKGKRLLHFIKRRGAWVEVQLVKGQSHCGAGAYSPLGLRYFVRVKQIIPVAKEELRRTFRDGAFAEVTTSAPLFGRTLRRIVAGAKRSLHFKAIRESLTLPKGRSVEVARATFAKVGPHRLRVGANTAVTLVRKRGRRSLVFVHRRCWGFAGWVPSKALKPHGEQKDGVAGGVLGGVMGGFLGGSRTAPKHLWLLGNSPLYWPDGSKAGVSYRTVQITANVSRPKPKLMCTVLRADRQMPKVEVCFTADSFKRATKRPPARLIARPKIVPQMVLEPNRITGNRRIVPGDKTKLAMKRSAQTRLIASIKMCLNDQGAVATAKMIKRSGYPDYDRKLQAGIRAWRYKPFKVNGRAVPVCTSVTFIYSQS